MAKSKREKRRDDRAVKKAERRKTRADNKQKRQDDRQARKDDRHQKKLERQESRQSVRKARIEMRAQKSADKRAAKEAKWEAKAQGAKGFGEELGDAFDGLGRGAGSVLSGLRGDYSSDGSGGSFESSNEGFFGGIVSGMVEPTRGALDYGSEFLEHVPYRGNSEKSERSSDFVRIPEPTEQDLESRYGSLSALDNVLVFLKLKQDPRL